MTDPIVTLDKDQLTIEPGGQTQCVVTVKNLGTIVDGFQIEVCGEGVGEWAEVRPPSVSIYPDQESTAVVVFAPPAGTPSGTYPFGVRAASVVDSLTSRVAEGDLSVEKVIDLQGAITPATSTGRWRGRHFIKLSNWSNAPLRMKFTASDPDERLAFLLAPEILDLPVGGTGHSQIRVKTRKPFLRGTPTRLPFQVVAEADTPDSDTDDDSDTDSSSEPPQHTQDIQTPRAVFDGAFNQRPILSRFLVIAATIAVLALAGGVAWALTRPTTSPGDLVQGPPDTPQLTALAGDATSVVLRWNPQPALTGYRIHQQTPDGTTTKVTDVDGALGGFTVTELTAQSKTCYQVEAVRQEKTSALSARQCATTPAAAPPPAGATPTPAESASAGAAESTAVTAANANPTAAGESGSSPTGDAGAAPGGPGAGGAGDAGPATSEGSTSETSGSAGSGSPTTSSGAAGGSQVFTAGQFVAVVFIVPAADASALPRSQARSVALAQAGLTTGILHTTDYPDLRLIAGSTKPPADSYLVYSGPYDSQAAAQAFCAGQPELKTCLPVEPAPRGG